MSEWRRRLVIFVRVPGARPDAAEVTARLGVLEAAVWARRRLAGLQRELGRDPRWETWLAVTPDAAGMASRCLPEGLPRLPQGPGDPGARMARVFRRMASGPVLVVGPEVPELSAPVVAEAFRTLAGADAVFGPREDGGFWLAGLARGQGAVPAGLLAGVRWASRHALSDALRTLPGHRIRFAAPLPEGGEGPR